MSTCLGASLRDARGGAAAKRAVKGESPEGRAMSHESNAALDGALRLPK